MKYIENVVIGSIDTCESDLFAYDEKDWCQNEVDKTYYTNERFLPKILVTLGIYPSVSEIRRNKPDLMITLSERILFLNLKLQRKDIWIAIGE